MASVADAVFSRNSRDAHEKLNNCIVKIESDWRMISGYQSEWVAQTYRVQPPFLNEKYLIDLNDLDVNHFSAGPYPLGMVNVVSIDSVYFLSRKPLRRNKFGLREENIDIHFIFGEEIDPRNRNVYSRIYNDGSLYQTLCGVYPSFESAVQNSGKVLNVAFDRAFSISRAMLRSSVLFHKTQRVGEVSLKTGEIELYEPFKHLKEKLLSIPSVEKVS